MAIEALYLRLLKQAIEMRRAEAERAIPDVEPAALQGAA